jgi:hypothetical protein
MFSAATVPRQKKDVHQALGLNFKFVSVAEPAQVARWTQLRSRSSDTPQYLNLSPAELAASGSRAARTTPRPASGS